MKIMEDFKMKLSPKIFKQLTNEPFLVQNIDGKRVEFHYMDQTPFLFQYASKGRFVVWTSDGKAYKVLIESTYYTALEDFYQPEVNRIWLNFLENVGSINRKINLYFLIPTVIIYMTAAFLASIYFADQIWTVLIALIFIIFISNMFQSRLVNNKVRQENNKAQDQIRTMIGQERFNELVEAQEKHYKDYFKFDDNEPLNEESIEQLENVDEKNGETDGK
jgi:hypothetical protein